MKKIKRFVAKLIEFYMGHGCQLMGHVDYCGLLNRKPTCYLWWWAIKNGKED